MIGLLSSPLASAQTAQTCAPTQDPYICVEVSGPAKADYSTTSTPTFWTMTVRITNGAANTLNRVKFNGTLSETPTTSNPISFVDPQSGLPSANVIYLISGTTSCALTAPNAISCGADGTTSIDPGQTLSFTMMSTLPLADSQIALAWSASFAEGNSTSPTANNGTAAGTLAATVSAPSGDSAAASFPSSGGTLATAPDTFSTKIVIPSTGKPTSATIAESPIGLDARCSSFKTCYLSDVSIPGFVTDGTSFLRINLWMDSSNIRKGTKIENVQIYYTGVALDSLLYTDYPVGACPGLDQPLTTGLPCINKKVYYRNKQVPGWTPALDGDFYWELINIKNGGFGLF